jgi:hypothetical protein
VGRPEVVASWLKYGRKLDSPPVLTDLPAFIKSWWLWWTNLQPDWRKTADGTLLRDVDGDWLSLRKGGNNGFFMIVLTLSWWLRAIDGVVEAEGEISKAFSDVNWVLDHLLSLKRARDEIMDDESVKKRWGPFSSILLSMVLYMKMFCRKI